MTVWRHKKRGTLYRVLIDDVTMQTKVMVLDDEPAVVYRDLETYRVYVRPTAEFYDGRFEATDLEK